VISKEVTTAGKAVRVSVVGQGLKEDYNLEYFTSLIQLRLSNEEIIELETLSIFSPPVSSTASTTLSPNCISLF